MRDRSKRPAPRPAELAADVLDPMDLKLDGEEEPVVGWTESAEALTKLPTPKERIFKITIRPEGLSGYDLTIKAPGDVLTFWNSGLRMFTVYRRTEGRNEPNFELGCWLHVYAWYETTLVTVT